MSEERHPGSGDLIDFVEGELPSSNAEEIRLHLKTCEICRSYVKSLTETFSLLAGDTVPEPPPGFWTHFAQRVRRRASSRQRRLILVSVPSVAAIVIAVVLIWWGTRIPVGEMDSMDLILAEMSTGEIVESLSETPAYGDMLLESADEEVQSIDQYLLETGDIYDLIDELSDEEKKELMQQIEELMGRDERTSKAAEGLAGKEC